MTPHRLLRWLCVVVAPSLQLLAGVPDQELAARRGRLCSLLDSSSAAVFKAADFRIRTNDVEYRYRQESNFLYLTGLKHPRYQLIIAPRGVAANGKRWRAILFSPEREADSASFSDGVVLDVSRFDEVLAGLTTKIATLYISAPDLQFVNDWLNRKPLFLERDSRRLFEAAHPGIKVKSVGTLMAQLRGIKSQEELRKIQRAIDITGDGLRNAIAACQPSMKEYELQAIIEFSMIREGAEYESFPSIIGSGPNSLIPHYDDNRRTMQKGDVVVMDVGAEVDGYAADVTRTIPVSGRFTEGQREVYSAVLRTQQAVIGVIRPGLPWVALDRKAKEILQPHGFAPYLTHSVSHHVGLDVHDIGQMDTLKAGMVITVEPGVYVPAADTIVAEKYRGFGIRIEDDVLVTENGSLVLSRNIPKEIGDIEGLMKR